MILNALAEKPKLTSKGDFKGRHFEARSSATARRLLPETRVAKAACPDMIALSSAMTTLTFAIFVYKSG